MPNFDDQEGAPGQQPGARGDRSIIGISELDTRVQEQIAKHGSVKEFHIVLWRQNPDRTGCNWNAHIERVAGSAVNGTTWLDIVPQMRKRFNLM